MTEHAGNRHTQRKKRTRNKTQKTRRKHNNTRGKPETHIKKKKKNMKEGEWDRRGETQGTSAIVGKFSGKEAGEKGIN